MLAINRGERAKKIRVRFEYDQEKLQQHIDASIEAEHPFRSFLIGCMKEACTRSIIPALEREVRRELTESAETRALEVFERNLRMLLLQPPVHAHCLLAIDPGYRSGCQVVLLDSCGQLMGTERIFIVGNDKKISDSRERLGKLVKNNGVDLIAIGNGAGCRAVEKMVSDLIAEDFADSQLRFVIVNEAGTSVYATSEVGREELPELDPAVRSAVSIGRRLLEPLAELVKINPANLGVGLYQHDIKNKHLAQALDEVVEACVNHVGVDVNTASPALMRYVSGLGQLTARRVYEHRLQHGPFQNREQFRDVAGFGEATFVQAAGFLRIYGGDNPLDATAIHPESYDLAKQILAKVNFELSELPVRPAAPPLPQVSQMVPAEPAAAESSTEDSQSAESNGSEAAGQHDNDLPQAAESEVKAEGSSSIETEPEIKSELGQADQNSEADAGAPQAIEPGEESSEPVADFKPADSAEPGTAQVDEPATGEQQVDPPSEAASSQPQPANDQAAAENAPSGADAVGSTESTGDTGQPAEQELGSRRMELARKLRDQFRDLDFFKVANELGVGKLLIKDLMQSLTRPSRDPRMDLPKPIFRRGILKIDDLKAGMQLKASILNIVDFGLFVDIGLGDSSLIHISQLSNRFISDPHLYFSVGDVIQVWVKEIDESRRRVILTAIRPHDPNRPARKRPARPRRDQQASGRSDSSGPRSAARGKPAQRPTRSRPAKPRKPAKPITKSMIDGKEPMRSFSDLAQLFKIRDDGTDGKKGNK